MGNKKLFVRYVYKGILGKRLEDGNKWNGTKVRQI
jgi:hypothetical protein